MNLNLKIFLILVLIIQLFLIFMIVRKKKLTMKYASFWIFLIIVMVFIVLFPQIVLALASFFGFEVASNMVFLLGFFFLFYISFIITTTISVQNEKIKVLIQEVSMLKSNNRVNKREK